MAALLGVGLGVAGVLLEDYLDITLRDIDDAERRLGLPVLGAIPELGPMSRIRRPRRGRQPQAVV